MEEKKKPSPLQIEAALAGRVDVTTVADLLGVTKQAIYKRPDWIKREMGGIKTPIGWLFDAEQVKHYQTLPGRPAEGRRSPAPFPLT